MSVQRVNGVVVNQEKNPQEKITALDERLDGAVDPETGLVMKNYRIDALAMRGIDYKKRGAQVIAKGLYVHGGNLIEEYVDESREMVDTVRPDEDMAILAKWRKESVDRLGNALFRIADTGAEKVGEIAERDIHPTSTQLAGITAERERREKDAREQREAKERAEEEKRKHEQEMARASTPQQPNFRPASLIGDLGKQKFVIEH